MASQESRRRFQVPLFFLLAYLIAWGIWVPTVLKANGIISWEIPGAGTLGLFGSSIAAFLVVGLTEGRAGVKQLATFMTKVRMRYTWLLLAILLPLVISLLALLVGIASGSATSIGKDLPLAIAPVYFLVQVLTMLLTEEPGWRGLALPRLQERFSPLSSSLILGVLWGLWHLPLWLIPGRPQASMPIIGFVIAVAASTMLMTWLQNKTGSGFTAVLFHAAMNTGFAAFGTLTGGSQLFWICTGVWALVAFGVYLTTGLRNSSTDLRPQERIAG